MSLNKTRSNALFERLTEKELEEARRKQPAFEWQQAQSTVIKFNEWLRRKDAEVRMKKKLIRDAKNEIRQEIYEIAQQD